MYFEGQVQQDQLLKFYLMTWWNILTFFLQEIWRSYFQDSPLPCIVFTPELGEMIEMIPFDSREYVSKHG